MPKKKNKCPKCGSLDLYAYRDGTYHRVRCKTCQEVFTGGIQATYTHVEEIEMTDYGPQTREDVVDNTRNASTKRLEHENRGFRDPRKNYSLENDE